MTPNVWIVPVNYNGTEDTRKCLRSLAELSAPAHVVLVDNASHPDPTAELAAEFPWVHIVRNTENLGWSGGNNTGIRYALERGADFVMLLNNDTTVAPDIVARLLGAFRAHPRFGVIGPVIRYMDEPDVVMTDGVTFNPPHFPGFFQRKVVPERRADPPAVDETDIVNGCCMMVRADVFQRAGLIDDHFFLIHEEADFCLRVKEVGFGCGVLAEPLVWHKGRPRSSARERSGNDTTTRGTSRGSYGSTDGQAGAGCSRPTQPTCAMRTTATATNVRPRNATRPTRSSKGSSTPRRAARDRIAPGTVGACPRCVAYSSWVAG
ncbi:N-acetylglucosaminyl-diphospho-decaprenol L-rhamnosyltransferase [Gemmata sp. SH-PL17]|uniref:glycosyltransferase family 2 protein n=1 Tax=Gemmata sp. SH-PL17 TaxID=1630693 RepID=UPI00078BFE28|nr:glycosyltransferase family 2 protein [Gemmata sp. SH-PL17]AMV23590.1 N-acetylglucosaminyl-diphospho-decaprenol L-rhamnosyltransferase [Gemmata sp. SH-PL17]